MDKAFFQSLLWPLLVIATLTEMFRLYYGYSGNLTEQVSHMSNFLLLTIFPQMLLILFLLMMQEKPYPWETVGAWIMLAFLVAELIVGHKQHKYLIRRATSQFLRLCQVDEDDRKID